MSWRDVFDGMNFGRFSLEQLTNWLWDNTTYAYFTWNDKVYGIGGRPKPVALMDTGWTVEDLK